jgi:hypothetical protein
MRFSRSVLIFALLLAGCGVAESPAAQDGTTALPATQAAPTRHPSLAVLRQPLRPAPSRPAPNGETAPPAESGPCDQPAGDNTPTPTPPERNELGEPTDPCATAEAQQGQGDAAQPGSGGGAQPCPAGPADDPPPALPQPTQPGTAAAGCATAQPVGVTVVVAQGGSGATPTPTPIQGQRAVGLPSQGQTIELAAGETFELRLGEGMDWSVQIDDLRIVAPEPGNLTAGSQGVFRALAACSTTLHANGDPTCRKSNPPCGAPSYLFEITILVR